ncbi:hypothetical protein [Actinacidiphila epipremni]|uniref:Uncharacterized protein n=1 Tax=Actinacidiphila epipremni TaxID=2053013 RepID=A0ABX0ZUU7_9ACTN|nr:hypothetical protein [Actinacidiphila epipremni]NJP47793.1 hypothetical protein [Actinacidiphila epipremni]
MKIGRKKRAAIALLSLEFVLTATGLGWSFRYGWTAIWLTLALGLVFAGAVYLCETRYLSTAITKLRRQTTRVQDAWEFLAIEGDLLFAQGAALVADRDAMVAWLTDMDPDAIPPAPTHDVALALGELSEHILEQQHDLIARKQVLLNSFDATDREVEEILSRRVSQRVRRRLLQPGVAESLTSTAVRIAGRRHAHLHEPWRADLFDIPEEGITVSPRERLTVAVGFVVAGLRLRMRDLAAPLWRPVDWLLSVDSRLNAFVTAAVGSVAVYFDVTEGLHVLLVERSEPCALLGGGLYGLARWIRRRRGIEVEPRRNPQH